MRSLLQDVERGFFEKMFDCLETNKPQRVLFKICLDEIVNSIENCSSRSNSADIFFKKICERELH